MIRVTLSFLKLFLFTRESKLGALWFNWSEPLFGEVAGCSNCPSQIHQWASHPSLAVKDMACTLSIPTGADVKRKDLINFYRVHLEAFLSGY
jgi:hypothetical protein